MQRKIAVIELGHGPRGVGNFEKRSFQLKHASFPAAAIAPAATISSSSKPKSIFASIFASILDALHHSRRIQARRVLGQYRHLISPDDPRQDHRQALDILKLEGSEHVGQ